MPIRSHRSAFLACLAVLLTAAAFLPSLENGFTNWDDTHSVIENPRVHELTPKSVLETFADWRHERQDFYKPLVVLSHAVEYHFFGLDPRVYHLTNLLLHLANVWVVFSIVLLLGLGPAAAFATAALFGVHPMHVESVAWVTQRKDVLYALFFLLAMLQYLRYRRGAPSAYGWSLFLFLLSLLAKPMAVTLAPVLFLLDWLERRAWDRRMFIEKVPFFALALAFGVLTLATATSTQSAAPALRFPENLWTMSDALVLYFKKLVAPVGLSSFYAMPVRPGAVLQGWPPSQVLVLTGAAVAAFLCRRRRLASFGLLFFFVTILPTLRLASASFLGADHYTYVPYLGLFLPIAAFFGRRAEGGKIILRAAAWIVMTAVLLALAALTWQRCGVWKDSETLWTNVLEKYHAPSSSSAYKGEYRLSGNVMVVASNNLGCHYNGVGKYEQAIEAFSRSIGISRNNPYAYLNRAIAYTATGQSQKALADLDRAAEEFEVLYRAQLAAGGRTAGEDKALEAARRRELAAVHASRGAEYSERGREEEARAEYELALALKPDHEMALNNRGFSYAKEERYDEAIADYRRALEILPGFTLARENLRLALELREKIAGYSAAIAERPEASLYLERGVCFARLHNYPRALSDLDRSIELAPSARAHKNRGGVRQVLGRTAEALADYDRSLELDPDQPGVRSLRSALTEKAKGTAS